MFQFQIIDIFRIILIINHETQSYQVLLLGSLEALCYHTIPNVSNVFGLGLMCFSKADLGVILFTFSI